jgi:autotransporter-associated beta strand protein
VTGGPTSGALLYTDAGASLTLSGPVTATGQFFILRAGNLTLSGGGSYDYLGVTGTVKVGATNGISTQAAINLGISGAATLDLNGFDQTITGLNKATGTGTGTGTVRNNVAGTKTLTINYNGETAATYAGTIVTGTGEIAVTKTGTGTFVLSGANTYAGTTTISAGTLTLNAATLADTADVRITTGATLNLNHAATDTVRSLYLDGVVLTPGTYGSLTSTATNKVAYITGNGILNVTTAATGFTAWAATNAGGQGPDQDFDGDGMPNAVEYLMGQTGSSFTPNPRAVNGVITWPKDPTANAVWEVRISDNLSVWTPAVTGVTDNGTSIQYTLPTGAQKKFARLQVTIP